MTVRRVNINLARFESWIGKNGLRLTRGTAETILNGRRDRALIFRVEDISIKLSESIKYLEINFGENCAFGAHVRDVCKKKEDKIGKMRSLISNVK